MKPFRSHDSYSIAIKSWGVCHFNIVHPVYIRRKPTQMEHHIASVANIKIWLKILFWTNTLAYHAEALMTTKKVFKSLV